MRTLLEGAMNKQLLKIDSKVYHGDIGPSKGLEEAMALGNLLAWKACLKIAKKWAAGCNGGGDGHCNVGTMIVKELEARYPRAR